MTKRVLKSSNHCTPYLAHLHAVSLVANASFVLHIAKLSTREAKYGSFSECLAVRKHGNWSDRKKGGAKRNRHGFPFLCRAWIQIATGNELTRKCQCVNNLTNSWLG